MSSYLGPKCAWLNNQRVLVLGPADDDPDVVIVFIQGEEQRLPAATRFQSEPEPETQQQKPARDYYDLEARLWKIADKMQRRCLARLAALQGLPVPAKYADTKMASQSEVELLLRRQERRRGLRLPRPEREDVKRRRAELQEKQRAKAAKLLEHQARVQKRRELLEQRAEARRQEERQQRLNASIDELLKQIWVGQTGS